MAAPEFIAVYNYLTRQRLSARKATREAIQYVFHGTVLDSTVELVHRDEVNKDGVYVGRPRFPAKKQA
ncbi:hypothetical protein V4F39_03305 [Aquincola sp. MAHUQ-54]|uniref:Uncharacterized protein n=1 Tax=Aquincola agrisoli TaxID=3119538 RepID=A0AAW9Q0P7_9BURK